MSRIGKKPITIPSGVEVTYANNVVTVKGSKGSLSQKISDELNVDINKETGVLTITPRTNNKRLWAKWGLYRVLVNNMVIGVTQGFQKVLEIEGVGYKAEMKGSFLSVSAGFSHPILMLPREGTKIAIDGPTKIVITGMDKQIVGQMASDIRDIRPPEPYKGKGIRYQGERIIRKAGKTGTK